jgi:D-amino-acid dehydrogenase
MSITDVSKKIVFCPLDGAFHVAGVAELGVRNTWVDQRQLATLLSTAAGVLPAPLIMRHHIRAGPVFTP